jgi:hypothetical protein
MCKPERRNGGPAILVVSFRVRGQLLDCVAPLIQSARLFYCFQSGYLSLSPACYFWKDSRSDRGSTAVDNPVL